LASCGDWHSTTLAAALREPTVGLRRWRIGLRPTVGSRNAAASVVLCQSPHEANGVLISTHHGRARNWQADVEFV